MSRSSIPAPLQRAARQVSRRIGRLTASSRMTPSFLIVGAQRCGTTSMYKTLTAHPAVLPAVLHKGVHYFDTGYAKGPAWYRGHFPLESTARRVERTVGTRPITGESSPYYMFHPLAGQRIAADLPDARLVVLLRDPVERAYSAHTHETARGYETEPFERALDLEPERLAGEEAKLLADPTYYSHHHQHNAYVSRGRYVEQLERLAGAVGRSRLHVIDSGDLFTDAGPVFDGLVDFLGLPRWRPDGFGKHNARPRDTMPPELRKRLEEEFAPYDERLAAWLGRTPSWRR
jgi:hypothetical protein